MNATGNVLHCTSQTWVYFLIRKSHDWIYNFVAYFHMQLVRPFSNFVTVWRVISLRTGACLKIIGLTETMRFLSIALFQGSITEDKRSAALSLEMKAANNPALDENIIGKIKEHINCIFGIQTVCPVVQFMTSFLMMEIRSDHLRDGLQKEPILLLFIERGRHGIDRPWHFQRKTDKRGNNGSRSGQLSLQIENFSFKKRVSIRFRNPSFACFELANHNKNCDW